ncbi:hypothetical protein CLU79DRAFT_730237 [Phycomyces nitens]|nr:hypothetical protein CLU79DRAFT_730237 [Phycomyces nitens]
MSAGGGGGGRGGGSSGGSSSGGKSSGSGSSSGSSGGSFGSSSGGSSGGSSGARTNGGGAGFSQPRAVIPNGAPAGSVGYSKGGVGVPLTSAPRYTNTRGTYSQYTPTNTGGYGPNRRNGWVGAYNPSLLYWVMVPSLFYLGYHSTYQRYNQNTGAYYAPQIDTQNNGPSNILINGTEYTSSDDNYHYTFNISTNNGYPMADHAYYASSDHSAHPADFAYRLTFSHVVEFEDINQNGMFDPDQDRVLAASSLQNAVWKELVLSMKPVPTNASQSYYTVSTNSTIPYNGTDSRFNIQLTWRTSNLQLNTTAPIPMQPNSLEYDFSVSGYPFTSSRLALAQLMNTLNYNDVLFDVNATTPMDIATQIKTNQTYGLSIGNYSEGRLEYQRTANVSDASTAEWYTSLKPADISANSYISPNDWIWGTNAPSSGISKLLFISMPFTTDSSVPPKDSTAVGNSTTGATVSGTFSGMGFLDVDVMDALASGSSSDDSSKSSGSRYSLSVLTIPCIAFGILISL